jgi:hypothetical protein
VSAGDRLRSKIHDNGGWVVSEPYRDTIRFECRIDNELPQLLAGMGYQLRQAGVSEKLLPVAKEVRQAGNVTKIIDQALAPTEVCVFEFEMFYR